MTTRDIPIMGVWLVLGVMLGAVALVLVFSHEPEPLVSSEPVSTTTTWVLAPTLSVPPITSESNRNLPVSVDPYEALQQARPLTTATTRVGTVVPNEGTGTGEGDETTTQPPTTTSTLVITTQPPTTVPPTTRPPTTVPPPPPTTRPPTTVPPTAPVTTVPSTTTTWAATPPPTTADPGPSTTRMTR